MILVVHPGHGISSSGSNVNMFAAPAAAAAAATNQFRHYANKASPRQADAHRCATYARKWMFSL